MTRATISYTCSDCGGTTLKWQGQCPACGAWNTLGAAAAAKPPDPAEVEQSATDPGIAAEMYLASVMLVDDQQDAERNYLDELAAALNIDPDLQVHLEQQAKGTA